jgi:hypothetical protein
MRLVQRGREIDLWGRGIYGAEGVFHGGFFFGAHFHATMEGVEVNSTNLLRNSTKQPSPLTCSSNWAFFASQAGALTTIL